MKLQVREDAKTCLYQTTINILTRLEDRFGSSFEPKHKNILLFTDGQNTIGHNGAYIHHIENDSLRRLKDSYPLILSRNKFFIVSYDQKQPEILHQVTEAFGSRIIETKELDLINALAKEGKLETWTMGRDLFTSRFDVTQGSERSSHSYSQAYDFSGQFTPLNPIDCKKGSYFINISISDSSNAKIFEGSYQSQVSIEEVKAETPASPRKLSFFTAADSSSAVLANADNSAKSPLETLAASAQIADTLEESSLGL